MSEVDAAPGQEQGEHDLAAAPQAMREPGTRRACWLDSGIAWGLGVVYCVWLLLTVDDLGYSRDEGFYFTAADSYLNWFRQLLDSPGKAIEQRIVDRYWTVNHEHPALIKSLFAWSRYLFYDTLGWFEEKGTAYRFVGMLMSSVSVTLTYLWCRRALAGHGALASRTAGIVAAASFALMPRVFYHSHLNCFDMPILAMWLLTSYVYWRSLEPGKWGWSVAAGLLYGLALNSKHNSWLLPFALIAHLALWRGPALLLALRAGEFVRALRLVPLSLWLMASVGPVVFYATWPWIWFDTIDRLREYVVFHTQHVFYNMEFLGETYFEPPFPRSYAPLMTIATVPAITLALAGAGGLLFLRGAGRALGRALTAAKRSGAWTALSSHAPDAHDPDARDPYATKWLWLLSIVISYAPWLRDSSPIFGGTKHWITAYPYMAMFAGIGFIWVCSQARSAFARQRWSGSAAPEVALAVCVLLAPFAITAHSHPWGLSAYTPAVGGASGAATLGLNRSYWGYTTGSIVEHINQNTERRERVFIHDTAQASWKMMADDGRVRKDLRPSLSVAGTQYAIYHHEQHMSRVEHQIWVQYGTVQPSLVAGLDGVPVIWVYDAKQKDAKQKDAKQKDAKQDGLQQDPQLRP